MAGFANLKKALRELVVNLTSPGKTTDFLFANLPPATISAATTIPAATSQGRVQPGPSTPPRSLRKAPAAPAAPADKATGWLQRIRSAGRPNLLGAAALATLATVGLGFSAVQGAFTSPAALTVPVARWPGHQYFSLAASEGLAQPHRLNLQVAHYTDTDAIVDDFLKGNLRVAQMTNFDAVRICSLKPERCPVVVMVINTSNGSHQLVANSAIWGVRALQNRAVAVSRFGPGTYLLSQALATEGLSLSDVKLKPQSLEAMPGQLRRGEVSAAAMGSPYNSYAVRSGTGRSLFDSRRLPVQIVSLLVVDPALLRDDKVSVTKLLRTWQSSQEFAARHPQQSQLLMGQSSGLSATGFREAEKGMGYTPLEEQAEMLAAGGAIERNLSQVQAANLALGVAEPGAPLPRVNRSALDLALQPSGVNLAAAK